jgi:outer membrane biogenesis lipoprotein LolB
MRKVIVLTVLVAVVLLSACNVTRTVTTKSEYWQRGDTSCVIQTKTIESYDASKKLPY